MTDAGRDYVEAARRIIADLEETERRASGEYQTPRGELSITMPIEFGVRHVIPIALAFIEEYPEVTLNLITSDRLVHMVDEHVDVATDRHHIRLVDTKRMRRTNTPGKSAWTSGGVCAASKRAFQRIASVDFSSSRAKAEKPAVNMIAASGSATAVTTAIE